MATTKNKKQKPTKKVAPQRKENKLSTKQKKIMLSRMKSGAAPYRPRYKILGVNLCRIVRFLGANGASTKTAIAVMAEFGHKLHPSTASLQTKHGRTGSGPKNKPIPEEVADKLCAALDKVQGRKTTRAKRFTTAPKKKKKKKIVPKKKKIVKKRAAPKKKAAPQKKFSMATTKKKKKVQKKK